MGAAAKENDILKLVHPGGFVETHRSPVAASWVMQRNPRHFVTRPDVFKFPWIVVRPESILRPGSVFYIVPCRTLYRLVTRDPYAAAGMGADVGMFQTISPAGDGAAAPGGMLKSCLKKHGSTKPVGRRVAFLLPGDDEQSSREEGRFLTVGGD